MGLRIFRRRLRALRIDANDVLALGLMSGLIYLAAAEIWRAVA